MQQRSQAWWRLAACVLAMNAAPAWSQGQIDSFQASATQVQVGSTVSFTLGWSIYGSRQTDGGSNLSAPDPIDGYQEWLVNWFRTDTTSARSIDLQVGGLSTSETFSGTDGQGVSGTWAFSMQFDTPGTVDLTAGGSFLVRQASTVESELATRYCYNTGDPDVGVYLACDSWSYSYPQSLSESDYGGLLNTPSLQIEVLAAPVPEPGAMALWLAGLGGLLAWVRRRPTSG